MFAMVAVVYLVSTCGGREEADGVALRWYSSVAVSSVVRRREDESVRSVCS